MSELFDLQATSQRVAEAICAALSLDTEIVDNELTVVAGTGRYRPRIGGKEENGDITAGFLYGRVLTTGQSFVVDDPKNDPTFDPSTLRGETQEEAEICCPIILDGRVIGLIALMALTLEQKDFMLSKSRELLNFLNHMALLLASKVSERRTLNQLGLVSSRLNAVLETLSEGVLAIDERGRITHYNRAAELLIGERKEDLEGQPLSVIWPDSPMLGVLRSGKGYTEREEVYSGRRRLMHFVVTAQPIVSGGEIKGVVASFRDIADIRRLVWAMTEGPQTWSFDDIQGDSAVIQRLKVQASDIAQSTSTVLITGESGTGKELFARAIHCASKRSGGPFVVVNCGAIPEALLESELFGYEEGAFTGARRKGKPGKFELAHGGTIFLDEIGDMPIHLQVKLLNVLQTRVVERVGGTRPTPVDVRIIAATNRDLEQMIQDGEFREDLYFRLNVIPLYIPPIRERRQDIFPLASHFLQKHARLAGKEIVGFQPATVELLTAYEWPGNVREIENAIEYAVSLEKGTMISPACLPPRVRRASTAGDGRLTLKHQLEEFERRLLQQYLQKYGTGGRGRDRLAEELGVSRSGLYKKLRQYGLTRRYRGSRESTL